MGQAKAYAEIRLRRKEFKHKRMARKKLRPKYNRLQIFLKVKIRQKIQNVSSRIDRINNTL